MLSHQRVLDILMIFKYLHNQIGRFNGNIQAECTPKFVGLKYRFTFSRTDVAAQNIRAVSGTELFFKIADHAFRKGIDLFMGVLRRLSAEQDAQGHNAADQSTTKTVGSRHATAKTTCDAGNYFRLDVMFFGNCQKNRFGSVQARLEELTAPFTNCCHIILLVPMSFN